MSAERLMKVLLSPHVSEKSTAAADQGQHVFKVLPDATKGEIKAAIEQLFSVKVAKVRTVNFQGKNKRFGARMGRRNHWKKAYVTLEAGQDIDFAGGE